jgi:hypothetical protein
MRVVDARGQVLELPDQEAWQGLASGQFGLQRGAPVAMRDNYGEVVQVQAEDVSRAMGAGFAPASTQEWQQAERAAQYSTPGQVALTALEGAGRGVSFGGTDWIASELGGKAYQEAAQARREVNPGTAIVSELGGALAPALLTSGASTGATAGSIGVSGARTAATLGREASTLGRVARGTWQTVSAPTRIVEGIGAATERGIAGLVGAAPEGAGMLSRMGRAAAPLAARGAIEGGIQGAGQVLTERSLGRPEVAAEDIIISGALLGAVTGGLLGAGGVALRGSSKAVQGIGKLDQAATETAVAAQTSGGWRGWMQQWAEHKAVRATGPTQKQIGDLEKMGQAFPEAQQRVPEMLLRELPAEAGKTSLAGMSRREILQAAEKTNERAGSRIGGVLRSLDVPELIEHQPDVIGVVQRARDEVVAPLLGVAGSKGDVAKLEGYLDDLLTTNAGTGFSDLHRSRVRLDADIKYHKVQASPFETELRKIRGIIEQELETKADEAAAALGGEFGQTYRAAKADYAASKWIQTAAERGVKAEGANRTISLGDHLFGIAGSVLAGGFGPIAGLATAAASSAVSNVIRSRGDQVAAAVGAHLAGGAAAPGKLVAMRTAARASESRVAQSVADIVTGIPKRAKSAAPSAVARVFGTERGKRREEYQSKREAVLAMASDPSVSRQAVAHIEATAPSVARATAQALQRQAQYMASKLPPERPRSTLQPELGTEDVSDEELGKWADVMAAAEDPVSVLEDLAEGRASTEAIDAVRELYPERWQSIQRQVQAHLERLTNEGKELPYERRAAISALLGIPADVSWGPQFVATVQTSYAIAKSEQSAATQTLEAAAKAAEGIDVDRYSTASDGIEKGLS